jgi:hypothetical protein
VLCYAINKSYMKRLIPILALALLAALPCRAQDPFVVEDEIQDVTARIEDAGGLDLAKITFSRKGSSKIEIDFRMNGAIPKTVNGEYCIITYLDIDDNAGTGVSRGEAGTELDVFAYKAPGDANWKCKLNKTSSLLAKESFQIAKFNQSKDGFSVDVSSPLFKKAIRMRGYAESISGGKALDRAPAEDFFTWDESCVPTNSAPAQE